jgi:hypothetical protein
MMGTAGLNTLAMVRLGVSRLMHSGARDGFGFLLIGLVAIGVAIWAADRSETEQNGEN